MRISDWSSDVCSSDLVTVVPELSGEVGGTLATLLKEGREAALDQAAVRARLPWLEIEAEAPLVLNLDGEPVESSRFRIECVPGRLRMHLPDDCPLLGSASPHRGAARPSRDPRPARTEEQRVGKAGGRPCRARRLPYH